MSQCPGLKAAQVGSACYNPSTLPCADPSSSIIMSDRSYGIGYCLPPIKYNCPVGWTPQIVESTGLVNGCVPPAACEAAKHGQFCHTSTGQIDSVPCPAGESSFFYTTNSRQAVHLCTSLN